MQPLLKGLAQFVALTLMLVAFSMLALSDSNAPLQSHFDRVELQQPKPKSIIKITHLGTTDAGIICLNGADPTGNKYGNVLIVSCQDLRKTK